MQEKVMDDLSKMIHASSICMGHWIPDDCSVYFINDHNNNKYFFKKVISLIIPLDSIPECDMEHYLAWADAACCSSAKLEEKIYLVKKTSL